MGQRSLRASKTGLTTADKAFKLKGWTQEYLAGVAGCSRATVINFFAQRPVDKRLFQAFCTELGLEWAVIAEMEADETPDQMLSIDELISSVRDNIYGSIYEKCGFMRVLDMSQPLGLDDIYTTVNILEQITGRRRLEMAELLKQANSEDFERFSLSSIEEKRVPGLEAVNKHPKLMILGKPGAGKTTFLKHLAIQCVEGKFKPKLMPLFITLKDFAEVFGQPSLLDYVIGFFASYGLEPITKEKAGNSTTFLGKQSTAVEILLNQGSVLVLLDGLDEVRATDNSRVLHQIQAFANQFHKNTFIITCRIAAKEYTFEQFTEVEIADFDNQQIATFTTKWFQAKQDPDKAETFIERLDQDKGIRELATSPILLTLLCLVFEESGTFPANRSELYKDGLDVLLKKWDAKRNIERDQAYKRLSLKRKEDLLSQIAINTFEHGNYFFKQKEVEREINIYIRNFPDSNTEEEALQLDSEAVLKSIEAQHGLLVERARGIYSFSHLTFHEYFTARKLVSSSKSDVFLTQLLPYLTEKRWQEVFLLTVGMLESADELLQAMKQQIDELVSEDDKIQQFMTWVQQKSSSVNVSYKPTAVRAFYLDLDLDRVLDRSHTLASVLVRDLDRDLSNDLDRVLSVNFYLDLDLDRKLVRALADTSFYYLDHALVGAAALAFALDLACAFKQSLQEFRGQLSVSTQGNIKQFEQWWKTNGSAWIEQLRVVTVEHRNIGHDWQFSPEQKQLLRQYYDANQLLVACLNSDCYVSREVRQEIESGLLLPTHPCAPPGAQ
jgi:predicted NACHT family NTPase